MSYNNWEVSFSIICFFEEVLTNHKMVDSFKRKDDIYFEIKHTNGKTFNVLLVNEYCLGEAAVLKAQREFSYVEYIVTGTNWNGYTKQAKQSGLHNNVGIFNLGEFMGCLYWTNPITYYRKDMEGNPSYAYKGA